MRKREEVKRTEAKLLPDPLCVSVKETAATLSVSGRTVWSWVADGTLPAVRLGRRTLIPLAAIRRLVAERTVRA